MARLPRDRRLVELTEAQVRVLIDLVEATRPQHRHLVRGAARRSLDKALRALHREVDPAPLPFIPEHPENRLS